MQMLRILAVAGSLLAAACDAPEPRPLPEAADLPFRGTKPLSPMGKVDFTMPAASGESYDFHRETEGRVALLFFGYTYCPDICAIHMATLARALEGLEPEERARVEVVFVTVDPERDTPQRLRGWLDAFDSTFVGVRGSTEEIEEALAYYRYPPPERSDDGQVYTVGHPALIYAFTPDGLGRVMYGPETSRQEWLHDLRMMLGYPWEAWEEDGSDGLSEAAGGDSAGRGEGAGGGSDDRAPHGADPGEGAGVPGDAGAGAVLGVAGGVEVLDAYAPAPADGGRTAVYLTLRNTGPGADTLRALATPAANSASLHDMRTDGSGMMRMVPIEGVPVPAGESVMLAPGRRHGMLEGIGAGRMDPGDTIRATLTFARGGEVTVPVRVVSYDALGG
jgi:protein SCO1/2